MRVAYVCARETEGSYILLFHRLRNHLVHAPCLLSIVYIQLLRSVSITHTRDYVGLIAEQPEVPIKGDGAGATHPERILSTLRLRPLHLVHVD